MPSDQEKRYRSQIYPMPGGGLDTTLSNELLLDFTRTFHFSRGIRSFIFRSSVCQLLQLFLWLRILT